MHTPWTNTCLAPTSLEWPLNVVEFMLALSSLS